MSNPQTLRATFRPGLVSSEQTWSVDAGSIHKDGANVVSLADVRSYRFADVPSGRVYVAVLDLYTDEGKHTIQCNLGKRHEQRATFLHFVVEVLFRLECTNPNVRVRPTSPVTNWILFAVGVVAAVVAVGCLTLSQLNGTGDTDVGFFIVAGLASVVALPLLIGPPPWRQGDPVTPTQTIEFIRAASMR